MPRSIGASDARDGSGCADAIAAVARARAIEHGAKCGGASRVDAQTQKFAVRRLELSKFGTIDETNVIEFIDKMVEAAQMSIVVHKTPRASSMRFSFRFGEENITTRERAMEYDHADSLASRSSCSHGASPTW